MNAWLWTRSSLCCKFGCFLAYIRFTLSPYEAMILERKLKWVVEKLLMSTSSRNLNVSSVSLASQTRPATMNKPELEVGKYVYLLAHFGSSCTNELEMLCSNSICWKISSINSSNLFPSNENWSRIRFPFLSFPPPRLPSSGNSTTGVSSSRCSILNTVLFRTLLISGSTIWIFDISVVCSVYLEMWLCFVAGEIKRNTFEQEETFYWVPKVGENGLITMPSPKRKM